MSDGLVEYVTDADYLTVEDDEPVTLHDGHGHVPHEAASGPRPAPPVIPRVSVAALPPPRRTKRLRLDGK